MALLVKGMVCIHEIADRVSGPHPLERSILPPLFDVNVKVAGSVTGNVLLLRFVINPRCDT
jgi:hypothetical protein